MWLLKRLHEGRLLQELHIHIWPEPLNTSALVPTLRGPSWCTRFDLWISGTLQVFNTKPFSKRKIYIDWNLAKPLQKRERHRAVQLPFVHYGQAAQEVPWCHTLPGTKAFIYNRHHCLDVSKYWEVVEWKWQQMTTCILCVLLGLVPATVQDLPYDPETQNDRAALLIAQFEWCKIVVSSARFKCIFAALESHLGADEFASSLHWLTQSKSKEFVLLVGGSGGCIYTNVKSIYARGPTGFTPSERRVMESIWAHSSPFSGSGSPVGALWAFAQQSHRLTVRYEMCKGCNTGSKISFPSGSDDRLFFSFHFFSNFLTTDHKRQHQSNFITHKWQPQLQCSLRCNHNV